MNASWNDRWIASWSMQRKNMLVRGVVSIAGSGSVLASLSMLSHGFFRHWDPVRREMARDPEQAFFGIAVLAAGVFTLKYGRLVADTLHPLLSTPTIREAAAAEVERARGARTRLVLPGDADFRP